MKRGATKEEIIRTTQDLIARNGIRAVRVDEIAQTLGISKRTLYEMFADKEDLVSACLDFMCHQQQERITAYRKRRSRSSLQRAFKLVYEYIEHLYTVESSFLSQIDGPAEGYHGLNLHEAFGPAAFIVKCRVDGLRDLGCCPSPFDSYLMLLGLETLSLRVRQEVESTRRLAEYCRNHPKGGACQLRRLRRTRATQTRRYFRFGSSAVFTIELKGTLDSTVRFVESLNLAAHMVMIGDSVTVVTHPASTTHKQLDDADLAAAGITPTLLRISLGLENAEDLIADFEQAFAQIG